jgi:hypothetical protein
MICSNPNEPQDQDMLHKQEHGRFKNIEWTAYETVHKKYLSLGTRRKYTLILVTVLLVTTTIGFKCIVTP